MKRMGMVMLVTVFVIGNLLAAEETVESGTAVQIGGNGASTKVSLALTESKATLWFTERSAGTSAGSNLSEYALALLPNSDLPMNTVGNEVHGGGSSLYLNWNIISKREAPPERRSIR